MPSQGQSRSQPISTRLWLKIPYDTRLRPGKCVDAVRARPRSRLAQLICPSQPVRHRTTFSNAHPSSMSRRCTFGGRLRRRTRCSKPVSPAFPARHAPNRLISAFAIADLVKKVSRNAFGCGSHGSRRMFRSNGRRRVPARWCSCRVAVYKPAPWGAPPAHSTGPEPMATARQSTESIKHRQDPSPTSTQPSLWRRRNSAPEHRGREVAH